MKRKLEYFFFLVFDCNCQDFVSGRDSLCFQPNLRFFNISEFLKFLILSFLATSGTTPSQPAIACSKLTIETLEQGVKYVQS